MAKKTREQTAAQINRIGQKLLPNDSPVNRTKTYGDTTLSTNDHLTNIQQGYGSASTGKLVTTYDKNVTSDSFDMRRNGSEHIPMSHEDIRSFAAQSFRRIKASRYPGRTY